MWLSLCRTLLLADPLHTKHPRRVNHRVNTGWGLNSTFTLNRIPTRKGTTHPVGLRRMLRCSSKDADNTWEEQVRADLVQWLFQQGTWQQSASHPSVWSETGSHTAPPPARSCGLWTGHFHLAWRSENEKNTGSFFCSLVQDPSLNKEPNPKTWSSTRLTQEVRVCPLVDAITTADKNEMTA